MFYKDSKQIDNDNCIYTNDLICKSKTVKLTYKTTLCKGPVSLTHFIYICSYVLYLFL